MYHPFWGKLRRETVNWFDWSLEDLNEVLVKPADGAKDHILRNNLNYSLKDLQNICSVYEEYTSTV